MCIYPVPALEVRCETRVANSRFIATVIPAFSVQDARDFVGRIRREFADAAHNVPAHLIGHGASVTAHCNDDGEPSGTAGRPVLAVLQGSGLGDVAVVVTRYFGGTKLGTGGLVRAYGDAVRAALEILPRANRVPTHTVMMAAPYPLYERIRLAIGDHGGELLDVTFTADVTFAARLESTRFPGFERALAELTGGTVQATVVQTELAIVMLPAIRD